MTLAQGDDDAVQVLVAVGRASVWAIAKGGSVWLRQGVRTEGSTEQLARGTR